MVKESDKEGLSKITFKLIIILISVIVIAAILIIILEFIKKGSEEIEFGGLNIDLEISQAKIINDSALNVTVKRNPGSGELVSMGFIIESENDSEIIQKNMSLNELEVETVEVNLNKINTNDIKKIQISFTFKLEPEIIKRIRIYDLTADN